MTLVWVKIYRRIRRSKSELILKLKGKFVPLCVY
jgi:hypothetical protein